MITFCDFTTFNVLKSSLVTNQVGIVERYCAKTNFILILLDCVARGLNEFETLVDLCTSFRKGCSRAVLNACVRPCGFHR